MVRAELAPEQQEKIAELLEAHYTAVPYELYQRELLENYFRENQIGLKQQKEAINIWVEENWSRIFAYCASKINNDPLNSTSNPAIAKGSKLPPEFVNQYGRVHRFFIDADIEDTTSYDADELRMMRLFFIASLTPYQNAIPEQLIPFSNHLPPSDKDLAIAKAAINFIDFMEMHSGDFNGTDVSVWKPLIQSENPVYRYLALEGIFKSVPQDLQPHCIQLGSQAIFRLSAKQKYSLLERLLYDDCTLIRIRLYVILGYLSIPDTLDYLKSEKKYWEVMPHNENLVVEFNEQRVVADPFAPAPATYLPPQKTQKEFNIRDYALETINESIKRIEEENATMPEKYRKMIEVYEQTGQVIEVKDEQ